MRRSLTIGLTVLVLLSSARADEKPEATEAQKNTAKENWGKLESTPALLSETDHFLIVAPKALEAKLKEIGELLEKHYDTSGKSLFTGKKEVPFKGKMTVYLLSDPDHITSFIRRVEKRRPLGMEKGSWSGDDDKLFVAAGPPRDKNDPPVEVQAAQLVSTVLLQRKAGKGTILPYWLSSGYGRATYYKVVGPREKAVSAERGNATRIIRTTKRNAQDVWNGTLEGDEGTALEPSVAYFLAYGPARTKFLALLAGFAPGENQEKKTMDQALEAAELKVDIVNKGFRNWIVRPD
jgi:hypothetical protein